MLKVGVTFYLSPVFMFVQVVCKIYCPVCALKVKFFWDVLFVQHYLLHDATPHVILNE